MTASGTPTWSSPCASTHLNDQQWEEEAFDLADLRPIKTRGAAQGAAAAKTAVEAGGVTLK
ncbi:hypothetical protein GCM10022631_18150 [Deinococcus rubellus]|uniref:Uncharacterized protein n=1 Tax=Deinococcus rubellus TaxID=1889240 RepID=A0ABY5YEV5_9DEIO|nr:hypothetical protein [Deinococcus rubellus]UWX63615.1 hypothetical protein N0D28_12865 [Deinococcus rubellus]